MVLPSSRSIVPASRWPCCCCWAWAADTVSAAARAVAVKMRVRLMLLPLPVCGCASLRSASRLARRHGRPHRHGLAVAQHLELRHLADAEECHAGAQEARSKHVPVAESRHHVAGLEARPGAR